MLYKDYRFLYGIVRILAEKSVELSNADTEYGIVLSFTPILHAPYRFACLDSGYLACSGRLSVLLMSILHSVPGGMVMVGWRLMVFCISSTAGVVTESVMVFRTTSAGLSPMKSDSPKLAMSIMLDSSDVPTICPKWLLTLPSYPECPMLSVP